MGLIARIKGTAAKAAPMAPKKAAAAVKKPRRLNICSVILDIAFWFDYSEYSRKKENRLDGKVIKGLG
ncbi:MAG: hypothetical protein A2Z79_01760 [Deltaproteobacteria bacterium GWA2_55_82]|nr:MAG: hypothetical protein A2Z79_01760 [Deltaproteobacteria bacterium GWA2_55_82]OGQ62558.1 MAG: hypothetical protein A3I81_08570 [Deltaproteobacteria bacterium RIFCSPLOWO2_02_FULL_55_12]